MPRDPGNKLLLSSQHAEPRVRADDGQHLRIHFIKLAFLTELKNAVKTEGVYSFDDKKRHCYRPMHVITWVKMKSILELCSHDVWN